MRKGGTNEGRQLELERKRESVLRRISDWETIGDELFPDVDWDSADNRGPNIPDPCICEEGCNCAAMDWTSEADRERDVPENLAIVMPSDLAIRPKELKNAAEVEALLRVAQAEETLEAIRIEVAHKSQVYLSNRTLADGKRERTRGYQTINGIEKNLRLLVKRYLLARSALEALGQLEHYPRLENLTRTDTKAVVSVYDPNRRGQRNQSISWIWTYRGATASSQNQYLEESELARSFCSNFKCLLRRVYSLPR